MNRKKFEIILYSTKKLEGTVHCRKYNMIGKIKIEMKGDGIVLTYHVSQHEHLRTNLASGNCQKCYYLDIRLKLNGYDIEAKHPYGKREVIRLTPAYKDRSGMFNYLGSIELEIKREKFK